MRCFTGKTQLPKGDVVSCQVGVGKPREIALAAPADIVSGGMSGLGFGAEFVLREIELFIRFSLGLWWGYNRLFKSFRIYYRWSLESVIISN